MRKSLCLLPCLLIGCSSTTSFVKSDTTLGRVVVYRNGVAYFERTARVENDTLRLSVPADKIDDFLKSLTVTDAVTGERAPVDFPSNPPPGSTGFTEMKIHLAGKAPHQLKLSYVTETPAWKPSYRVVIGKDGKVSVQAWAIVDNTSGEDWNDVKLGVGSSSALSFRFDLRSVRLVQRETLHSNDLFALAPPTGGSSYGQPAEKRVVGELTDGAIAAAVDAESESLTVAGKPAPQNAPALRKAEKRAQPPGARARGMTQEVPAPSAPPPAPSGASDVVRMAQALRSSNRSVVIEGFADKTDGDKFAASLDRANKVRDQLVRNGVDPSRVVATGQGEQGGRAGGVRIVEGPLPKAEAKAAAPATPPASPQTLEPIGTSHFESTAAMTVQKGSSAMVSILDTKTEGEVVYFYDAESPRGNASFPFKAVRLKNPTDSVLESGPVTVFGEGRFIGEGLAEPIPARSMAFVPFALDRQIVVERKDTNRDTISRILSVQRGVFSSEVLHTRRFTYALRNRMTEPATVYVRHTVADGYKLAKLGDQKPERIGSAQLFRVELPANGAVELGVEESTPVFKTIDLRSPADMDQVRLYVSAGALESPLKGAIESLIKTQQEIGNVEQRILTNREQMQAYRARMDELHAQVVSLRLVKTGGALMKNLEKKLQDVSDKLSQATVDLAALEETAMLLRIRFQDGIAELSLEKKG
ncbi:MAG TPA: OmpA family protein [Polyangiaceae bacterium]|nr:OmpA family protein [Polyangiaceae bacterium]